MTPTALFLHHRPNRVNPHFATHLALARELGIRPVLAAWRDVRVTAHGTYLVRAEEVTSALRKRRLPPTFLEPDLVLHRSLINRRREKIIRRMAQLHPNATLSYSAAWPRISRKVASEIAFTHGVAQGLTVARPLTFVLNGEAPDELRKFGRTRPVIFKPSRGSQCFGIQISTPATFDRILAAICRRREFFVAQEVIPNAALYEGHRTDLRLYALVTSFSPLQFRVYHGGVTRIAAHPEQGSRHNDKSAILTGSSYRKRHHLDMRNTTVDDLLARLSARGIIIDDFWERVERLMWNVFSCLAASSAFAHLQPQRRFYLTGFDLLLRIDGRHIEPLFLESNYVPQLNGWGRDVDRALRHVHRQWLCDLYHYQSGQEPSST